MKECAPGGRKPVQCRARREHSRRTDASPLGGFSSLEADSGLQLFRRNRRSLARLSESRRGSFVQRGSARNGSGQNSSWIPVAVPPWGRCRACLLGRSARSRSARSAGACGSDRLDRCCVGGEFRCGRVPAARPIHAVILVSVDGFLVRSRYAARNLEHDPCA